MSKVRISGAIKDVSGGKAMLGGLVKSLSRVAYSDGTNVVDLATFSPPMSAAASFDSATGSTSGDSTATTNSITVTPTGGTAPYTYAWTKTSGDGTVVSPTKATTRFSQFLYNNTAASGVFLCTVTDSLGATATASVNASFISISSV